MHGSSPLELVRGAPDRLPEFLRDTRRQLDRFASYTPDDLRFVRRSRARCPVRFARVDRTTKRAPTKREQAANAPLYRAKARRSERRRAWVLVGKFLVQRINLLSGRVGTPTSSGGFYSPSVSDIERATGLSRSSVERALADFTDGGLMLSVQPVEQSVGTDGSPRYIGHAAIRMFTIRFFELLGRGLAWRMAQRRAYKSFKQSRGGPPPPSSPVYQLDGQAEQGSRAAATRGAPDRRERAIAERANRHQLEMLKDLTARGVAWPAEGADREALRAEARRRAEADDPPE